MQKKTVPALVVKIPRNAKPQASGIDRIADCVEVIAVHQPLVYVIIFDEDVCSFEMKIDKRIYNRIVACLSLPLYVELSGGRHKVRCVISRVVSHVKAQLEKQHLKKRIFKVVGAENG